MRRPELEHLIRAAAEVAGVDEIVVVGSQAILAQFPDAPAALVISQEADVYPPAVPELAEKIDGALGDGSRFHETFGYYAHGVGPETAKAPRGWEQRLVRMTLSAVDGGRITAWCLEANDLVLAKAVAGRERDWEYIEEALRYELVDPAVLRSRLPDLPVDRPRCKSIERMLTGTLKRINGSDGA
jgi:hypothetical protein